MQVKFTHIKYWGLSILISAIFLVIVLISSSVPIPFTTEKLLLRWFEVLKPQFVQTHQDNLTDSVILVDTHYTQELVMERIYTKGNDGKNIALDVGNVPITSREKLNDLLSKLNKKRDYKYIILDVSLDKAVAQPEDSSLYNLIASMPRLFIAMPKDNALASDTLYSKAGQVLYHSTLWENDFIKFPICPNGEKSLPLKLYEDSTHQTVISFGPFYFDKGLIRNSIFITYDFIDYDFKYSLDNIDISNVETSNKYILIGDYVDDVHNTYKGNLPGTIINFNAFLTILNGHHRISLWLVLIMLAFFTYLSHQTIVESRFTWLFMWIGYPIYLSILCFIIYFLFNEIYDVLIATSLFYSLKTIIGYWKYRKIINRKIKSLLKVLTAWLIALKHSCISISSFVRDHTLRLLHHLKRLICTLKSKHSD